MAFNLPEYYQRLSGTFHIANRNVSTGKNLGGLFFVGDASELTLDTSQDFVEHMEHQSGDGKTDVRIPRQTTMSGSITLDNTGTQNFRNFLRGKLTKTAGATITSEAYVAPAPGTSLMLNSDAVATWTSLTSNPAGTTYVNGVDYVRENRLLYIPVGSAIADEAPLLANYASAATTQVDFMGEVFTEYFVLFQGYNTINKKNVALELFKVSFDSASLGNLLGDEILTMTCPFTALFEPLQSQAGNLAGYGNYVIQD